MLKVSTMPEATGRGKIEEEEEQQQVDALALESGLVGLLSGRRRKETPRQHVFRRAVGILVCFTIACTLCGAIVSLSGKTPKGISYPSLKHIKASRFYDYAGNSGNSGKATGGGGGDGQCRGLYGITKHKDENVNPDDDPDPEGYILALYNPGPVWSWFFAFIPTLVHAIVGLIPYLGPLAEGGLEITKWVWCISSAKDAASETPDAWSGYIMICYLIFSFNFRSLLGPIIASYAYTGSLAGPEQFPAKYLVACLFTVPFFLFSFAGYFIAAGIFCIILAVVCGLILATCGDIDGAENPVVGGIFLGILCFFIWIWFSALMHVWVDPNCGVFNSMGFELEKRGMGFAEWFAGTAKSKYQMTDAIALMF